MVELGFDNLYISTSVSVQTGTYDVLIIGTTKALDYLWRVLNLNTPGTRVGPGKRDRKLALKNRKNTRR